MPRAVFDDVLKQYTSGLGEAGIDARNYRDAVEELLTLFPALPRSVLERYTVAIDGIIVHQAFLEQLGEHSELRFISPIRGG